VNVREAYSPRATSARATLASSDDATLETLRRLRKMLIGRWKSKDKGSSKSSSGSGGAGKKKRKFGREGKDERESLTLRFFNDGLRNAQLNARDCPRVARVSSDSGDPSPLLSFVRPGTASASSLTKRATSSVALPMLERQLNA